MSDARQLIRIIQVAGKTPDNYLSDVVVGVVTHISPLVVKVDKLQLTSSFVILPGHVTVNAVGDRLRMLRCGKGQKYYVLENMDFTSGSYDAVIAQIQQDIADIESGKVPYSAYTANDVLDKIKTVDGIGSGLDADKLGGHSPSYFTDFASALAGNQVGVKFYGCVGDGVTDDSVAFQNAINGAIATGKTLYIENGTYLITNRLEITAPLTMVGGNHDASIILFGGSFQPEAPYSTTYWEQSNCAISIQDDNCILSNFTLKSTGSKLSPSQSNGIICHYPKVSENSYNAAGRTRIDNVDVYYFKAGIFLYAGWNRYISCCHFIDNQYGMRWDSLELSTVGAWSASGDIVLASQFVGNTIAGLWAKHLFEFMAWNCVYEYNQIPIWVEDCQDITFKNCWNEANLDNIYVKGCARFEGGYNITPSTVDHVLSGGSDIVFFSSKTDNTVYSNGEIIFKQQGGIITKGVSISSEVSNMIQNPYFQELSGGTTYIPSLATWDVYTASYCSASNTVKYGSLNSCKYLATGLGSDQYFGVRTAFLSIDVSKGYTFSFWAKTPSRAGIDSLGAVAYIAYKNSANETILIDNRSLTFVGDDSWEEKSFALTPPGGAATIQVGFGCYRNGEVYFADPVFSRSDSLIANDVFMKLIDGDADKLAVTNLSGVEQGRLPMIKDGKLKLGTTELPSVHINDQAASAFIEIQTADVHAFIKNNYDNMEVEMGNSKVRLSRPNSAIVFRGSYNYGSATGTDTYAMSLENNVNAYIEGMSVTFKVANTNTGACTLNINSIGAAAIKKNGSADLVAGDLPAGKITTVIYDGTNFQIP